jgi:hypothetical protein
MSTVCAGQRLYKTIKLKIEFKHKAEFLETTSVAVIGHSNVFRRKPTWSERMLSQYS